MKKKDKIEIADKMKLELKSIGIIHTPYKDEKEIPCQGYKSERLAKWRYSANLKKKH